MRIIAGHLKGMKLATVGKAPIRPTSDRVREAIFNILGHRVQDAAVLDLFAGTGALGIESLSRGARMATFVETDPAALRILDKNLHHCRMTGVSRILRWDIRGNLACLRRMDVPADLVFMDPPYREQLVMPTLSHLNESAMLAPSALIVAEHPAAEKLARLESGFILTDQRVYGKTIVSFLIYDTGNQY